MLKTTLLVAGIMAALCLHCPSGAQQQSSIEVPPVIPPSPDAAALGKYGSIPVGLHTGIPEITIPIFTIKTGRLEVPIALSYHAAGNKVGQTATSVGLGWSLQAGGVVSRSVVGKVDVSGFWLGGIKSAAEIVPNDDYNYVMNIAHGADGESDYYFYNFLGRSGKFVYEQNDNQTPFLIPEEPLDVKCTSTYCKIVDETGTVYMFEEVEDMVTDYGYFASSYYLSEIISADGTDHIYFSYTSEVTFEHDVFYSESIGPKCLGVNGPPEVPNHHAKNHGSTTREIHAKRLSSITYANGKVEFVLDNDPRLDSDGKRLSDIKVYAKNSDDSYTLRKTFTLNADYFESNTGVSFSKYRLKLTGLTEKDALTTAIRKHHFFYEETITLPPKTSLAQDWWGYYNGKVLNKSLIPTETIQYLGYQYNVGDADREPDGTAMQAFILKTIMYPTGGYTEFDFEPHKYLDEQSVVRLAGGLRVKEMRDYYCACEPPVKKIYKYGTGESGRGTLLIPTDGLGISKQANQNILTELVGLDCRIICQSTNLDITGRPALDLTTLNGATVVYPEVAVYEESASAPNGKSVHKFEVVVDVMSPSDQAYNNGRMQLNDSWKGGQETWSAVYSDASTKIEETGNTYSIYNSSQVTGTKVGWKVSFNGCIHQPWGANTMNHFYFFDYPIYSGVKKLTRTKTTRYSSTNSEESMTSEVEYEYGNLSHDHQQLTKQTIVNHDGETFVTRHWYPADYVSGDNVTSLVADNIISKPIKSETHRNGQIVSGIVNRLDPHGNPFEIYSYESGTPQTPPAHEDDDIVPPGYTRKLDISYDPTSKNITQVQKTDDVNTSYLWGYNNSYPVAKIENATVSKAAYTSFESTDKGNWEYNSATTHGDIPVKTGTRYYKMNAGDIEKSLTPGKYKLEYWAKGTAITLSGGTITAIRTSPADANGWILYEKEINVSTTVNFQMIGASSAHIDELRIYPVNAMMTTYTYDPVNGMTSVTDPNNFTVYYEYDEFGRLKHIKDKDGNIVKAQEYHYKAN